MTTVTQGIPTIKSANPAPLETYAESINLSDIGMNLISEESGESLFNKVRQEAKKLKPKQQQLPIGFSVYEVCFE